VAKYGAASAGEIEAWEAFFLEHDPMIRQLVSRYTGRRAEYDDVYQEVWMSLARELSSFQYDPGRGTLPAWLATVAHHAAGEAAGSMSRGRTEGLTPELAGELLDPGLDPAVTAERVLDRENLRATINELGTLMPELSHRIAVMRWIEERDLSEIAAEVRLPKHAVMMRLGRATKKLEHLLRGRWDEPE